MLPTRFDDHEVAAGTQNAAQPLQRHAAMVGIVQDIRGDHDVERFRWRGLAVDVHQIESQPRVAREPSPRGVEEEAGHIGEVVLDGQPVEDRQQVGGGAADAGTQLQNPHRMPVAGEVPHRAGDDRTGRGIEIPVDRIIAVGGLGREHVRVREEQFLGQDPVL